MSSTMDGDELIQSLDKLYFKNEEVFNLNHVTDKLPANLTSEFLVEYKSRLERILSVVSRKVSELILSHQPTYVDELQRIANLQKSITHSIRVCTQGRSCLRFIKEGSAKNGITIVEHHRKRESLVKLLDSLSAINDLRKSVLEIRGLIDNQEDFPKAIQMCKDGKALLSTFDEYQCVHELGAKLNDTLELIGEQVDIVLSKMCLSYDAETYAKLQNSYILMNRSEIAVDQLLMHFCSAINSQAHNIVIKHLTLDIEANKDSHNQGKTDKVINVQDSIAKTRLKKDFQDLCNMLSSYRYLDCLLELCTSFWFIMLNYKRILKWHEVEVNLDTQDEVTADIQLLIEDAESSEIDRVKFKKLYVEQKLVGGLSRLWYDVKRKLSLLILNHDFSGYRFDEFIKILGIVDLVIQIGDEFCGQQSSGDLQDCINTQALNFFNAYHKSSMDELTMFLENELWEMVPVKNDFKLVQLKEFSFLRSLNTGLSLRVRKIQISNNNEPLYFTQELIDRQHIDMNQTDILATSTGSRLQLQTVIPFDKVLQMNKDTADDFFSSDYYFDREEALPVDKISLSSDSGDDDDDEESNSELDKDFVEEEDFVSSEEDGKEQSGKYATKVGKENSDFSGHKFTSNSESRYLLTKSTGPTLTNSSLNVLRLFGRYIQMMSVLEPISYEILMRIYNLMDHYTMIVYKRFGPDSDRKTDDKNLSPKLKVVIRSIRESLIGHSNTHMEDHHQPKSGEANISVQQGVPNISSIITNDIISNGQTKVGDHIDPKKAVAVESLIFLVNQLWNLQEYLESLIPAELRPKLKEQFAQSQSIVPDFLKACAEMNSLNNN